MSNFLKNIPHEEIVTLGGLVEIATGQVVSRTLAQNKALSVTVFAFDKGEEIGTHASHGDAMVTVLEGTGKFTVDGQVFIVKAGETLVMPAGKPHAVFGVEPFKMLLVVVFPQVEN
ncbi:MAG: cupin domain-containing protein [Oscillospiraceae bacterium]